MKKILTAILCLSFVGCAAAPEISLPDGTRGRVARCNAADEYPCWLYMTGSCKHGAYTVLEKKSAPVGAVVLETFIFVCQER